MNPSDTPMPSPSEGSGLSRRSIVGAAAWSAPAIVLSAASPATATSLGILSVRPESITVQAGTPTSIQIGLAPAGSRVPIAIDFDTAGAITTSPTDITSLGEIGYAVVSLSTALTEPRIVTAVATAPGYSPVTFTINVEAPAIVEPEPEPGPPTISVVSAPESVVYTGVASTEYVEFALTPPAAGVTVTLTRDVGPNGGLLGLGSYSLVSDASGRVRTTVGAMFDKSDTVDLHVAAPGYKSLVLPIATLAAGAPDPTNPGGGGVTKTHTAYLISVTGGAMSGNNYILGDTPLVVTVGLRPSHPTAPTRAVVLAYNTASGGIRKSAEVTPSSQGINVGETAQFVISKVPGSWAGTVDQIMFGNYGTDFWVNVQIK